ncbi:unnamed protein product, partial [Closterium sp. NIES-54]
RWCECGRMRVRVWRWEGVSWQSTSSAQHTTLTSAPPSPCSRTCWQHRHTQNPPRSGSTCCPTGAAWGPCSRQQCSRRGGGERWTGAPAAGRRGGMSGAACVTCGNCAGPWPLASRFLHLP